LAAFGVRSAITVPSRYTAEFGYALTTVRARAGIMPYHRLGESPDRSDVTCGYWMIRAVSTPGASDADRLVGPPTLRAEGSGSHGTQPGS
jgi:hypothetical protein